MQSGRIFFVTVVVTLLGLTLVWAEPLDTGTLRPAEEKPTTIPARYNFASLHLPKDVTYTCSEDGAFDDAFFLRDGKLLFSMSNFLEHYRDMLDLKKNSQGWIRETTLGGKKVTLLWENRAPYPVRWFTVHFHGSNVIFGTRDPEPQQIAEMLCLISTYEPPLVKK